MHRIPLRGAHFLLRAQYVVKKYMRVVRTFQSGDCLVEFHTSWKTRQETPGLPLVLTCRLIHFEIPGFRPSILLTSLLDPVQFPAEELIGLYHRRWRIETIYREWKHNLDITNLRSHTPAGIVKEMHAHLLLSNLVRFIMTEAAHGTGKTPLDYSFLKALAALRTAIEHMSASSARMPEMYRELLLTLQRSPIRQRPGRRYPRRGEKKIKPLHTGPATCPVALLDLT